MAHQEQRIQDMAFAQFDFKSDLVLCRTIERRRAAIASISQVGQ